MTSKDQHGDKKQDSRQKNLVLYLHDLIYMLAGIILVLLLFFRVVVVSGPSMYDTLWDGDWLLLTGRLFYREPQYGDIVVASQQSFNDGEPIVKRVIATEGQTVDIDFIAGTVYVDGTALEEEYTYTPTLVDEGMQFPLVVKNGCIFVMGDNRNRSKDSRDPAIGLIDKREVLGRAVFLLFPGTAGGNGSRQFGRIGVLK